MTAAVQPRQGLTPYAATGDRLVIGLCLLIVGVFWLRSRAGL
jgi:apolipoprotein N-acyltransferase